MNIKLEIAGEQFEIELANDGDTTTHADGFIEDTSTWGYELFQIGEDGERISMDEDDGHEEASEAAMYAIAHLVGILTNKDDHSIED